MPDPIAFVDDQPITTVDMRDLLSQAEGELRRNRAFTLFTLNLDHLVKRRQSPPFRELYARADLVTADGWPVVSLAGRQCSRIERTTGADLVVPLCRLAARLRLPVALFGTTDVVLVQAATKLRDLCPGLEIVFVESPPLGFDPVGAQARAAAARIAASGARLCFVALGAPKQEFFADHAARSCDGVGFVAIGAALDFVAGAHRRAPAAVQKLKLEWAWRLASQPRRLGPRYVKCALLFARLTLGSAEGVRGLRS